MAHKFIIQAEINGAPAWCLNNGLATRDRSMAYPWPSLRAAGLYAAAHLDPKTPRVVLEVSA